MFTGIVETRGVITACRPEGGMRRLAVRASLSGEDPVVGASVSVSGVCLTVTGCSGGQLSFDVVSETLSRTTLGGLGVSDEVNLERSLRVGDRLDGHFVQGHVDGVGSVVSASGGTGERMVWFSLEPGLMRFVIPKGSIAIDGVSLTIAEVSAGRFSVALIPETLSRTTLSGLSVGRRVNIETDILARTVVTRMMSADGGGLDMDALREAGMA